MNRIFVQRLRNAIECLGLVFLAIFIVACLEHVFTWKPSIDTPMRKCTDGFEYRVVSDGNSHFMERVVDRYGNPVPCTEK